VTTVTGVGGCVAMGVGAFVGVLVGDFVGVFVGALVGTFVGTTTGTGIGTYVGTVTVVVVANNISIPEIMGFCKDGTNWIVKQIPICDANRCRYCIQVHRSIYPTVCDDNLKIIQGQD
jgi:hypothetical protein